MGVWYTTRDSVKRALDIKANARDDAQIDDAIEAASRAIEQRTNRVFYPWTGTRYLDWPNLQLGTSYVLWLEEAELVSLTELKTGTAVVPSADYNLEPNIQGPPYDRVELKLNTPAAFGLSDTHQRDVTLTGVFGYTDNEIVAGALTGALADTTSTTIAVSNPAVVGVGSLLRLDNERLRVLGRNWADSGQTGTLGASNADTLLAVSDGSAFVVDETVLLDAERMLVTDVAGNNLVVRRAYGGTVLAAHTTASVFRQTSLLVERGSVGTTAASHLTATTVNRWDPPGPISTLCRAQALDTVLQEQSGYSRTVGSGDAQRAATGSGLGALWCQVEENFRRVRLGVV
jgi:hypothetical protein